MLGLDFGTTNSAIARRRPDGGAALARFGDGATTFRSILYVDPDAPGPLGLPPCVSAGPEAVRAYVETGGRGRLIQSIKAHLGARSFTTTDLFGVRYRLEDLVGLLLRHLRAAAERELGPLGRAVVVGRPVRFAGARDADDEAFALARLRAALAQAGFDDVTFALEPVAAAASYRARLAREELVLIGDFGGGTSDFSLVRVSPRDAEVLGVDGVALAGDAFDARLIRHLAAPGLGLGSTYRTAFGRELPVPGWLFERVERWDQLSFLKTRETSELLRRLQYEAAEPEKIDALVHLVEDDLGFRLHGAVEATKRGLSDATEAPFAFADGPIALAAAVARSAMDAWIAAELAAIGACVDRLLAATSTAPDDVAAVFLTGGSSFVPAVRALFATRFGAERLRGGEELTSVATGLALLAG